MAKVLITEIKKPCSEILKYFVGDRIQHNGKSWYIIEKTRDVLPLDNPPKTITLKLREDDFNINDWAI